MNCVSCGAELVPHRPYLSTCSQACHDAWIARLIAEFGEYKIITSLETGKRYRVPTRTILELGVSASDLVNFPEVTDP